MLMQIGKGAPKCISRLCVLTLAPSVASKRKLFTMADAFCKLLVKSHEGYPFTHGCRSPTCPRSLQLRGRCPTAAPTHSCRRSEVLATLKGLATFALTRMPALTFHSVSLRIHTACWHLSEGDAALCISSPGRAGVVPKARVRKYNLLACVVQRGRGVTRYVAFPHPGLLWLSPRQGGESRLSYRQ